MGTHKITIPRHFLRIMQSPAKILVYYGGRGGGKSEGIARLLLLLCYSTNGYKVFVARETQDEYDETLLLVFKDIIHYDKDFAFLKDYVKIFRDRIELNNGSAVFFKGLSEKTHDKVKGIKANLFWFDEAHNLQELTYELLVPSIRENNSKVVISFNPLNDYDFVAREFLKNPADNVEIIKINADDNPYLPKELADLRESDRKRLSYENYLWKWEGGFRPLTDNALFDGEALKQFSLKRTEFVREDFARIVIGIDPAMTSKDFNNESGLVVAGLDTQGVAVLIEDSSGHLKPNELAEKVSRLYHSYNADAVVVEINQGGDYVKSTILSTDPSLKVIEARAKQDKVKRMLPIANEVYMQKIRGLSDKASERVLEQFRKFSSNGYLGAKGESPDRAEAFAWACFELLGISEYDTQGTFFNRSMLDCKVEGERVAERVAYAYIDSIEYGLLVFNVASLVMSKQIEITHAVKGRVEDFVRDTNALNLRAVRINLCPISQSVVSGLQCPFDFYQSKKLTNDEKAQAIAPYVKGFVNAMEVELFEWEGIKCNQILTELLRFKLGEDKASPILQCFFDMILTEKKL